VTIALLLAVGVLVLAVGVIALFVGPARAASAVRPLIEGRVAVLERGQERVERTVREEIAQSRSDTSRESAQLRDEVRATLKQTGDSMDQRLDRFASQIAELSRRVDAKLQAIQEDNARRLETMRQTVDEKLQGTLERRLGESFKLIGDRLEAVHAGLGEMRALASGVGDLRKVLSNVKVRGTWGEIQLGNLLAEMLAPEQYVTNVATKPRAAERVEFAIRLPGGEDGEEVLLPIDSKFPMEDYQRLVDASERGDADAVDRCARQLEQRIRQCAQDVCAKYLNPPHTTDFGILFLPTEGLYAEVVRRSGLIEALQREHRVAVAGPTTLAALLNSLQLGFKTLAIQKRSSEVWQVLAAVKTEFGKFGEVIEAVDKKLVEASQKLGAVGTRSRAIERRLRAVQELPPSEAQAVLLREPTAALSEEQELEEYERPA
jgi:DNA recombination protein RmuC